VLIHTDGWFIQLGLASDLVHIINQSFVIFSTRLRPRTRYIVFCSSWTLLSGIFLVMLMALASAEVAIIVQLIVYVFLKFTTRV
jgi:NADH:ubiquinone oxidoreductase subunit K